MINVSFICYVCTKKWRSRECASAPKKLKIIINNIIKIKQEHVLSPLDSALPDLQWKQ